MVAHATASLRKKLGAPVGTLKCDGWEGPCDRHDAVRQRQNTAYVDDKQNWVTLCQIVWLRTTLTGTSVGTNIIRAACDRPP